MIDDSWTTLRFLESSSNLQSSMEKTTGRRPSTTQAREVGVCLQQGRLFYNAAAASEMAIRPLLQFYGMLALAKALALAKSRVNLATLPQSHGISDVSEPCKKIADLRIRLGKENGNDGMFQRFNDAVSELTGLRHVAAPRPITISIPAADSSSLLGITLPISELFARIPGLHTLYEETFKAPAKSVPVRIYRQGDHWKLQIVDANIPSDLDGVAQLVSVWRDRFPFIREWSFEGTHWGWGGGWVLLFTNHIPQEHEFDPMRFQQMEHGIQQSPQSILPPKPQRPISEILPPLGGRYSNRATAIAPLPNGCSISDYSVHYLALYLLSSLVRYRPNIWVHAISQSVADSTPADDGALALIETFLELNATEIPQLVAKVMGPRAPD